MAHRTLAFALVPRHTKIIANQENLLNVYRCMFSVDLDAVAGQHNDRWMVTYPRGL